MFGPWVGWSHHHWLVEADEDSISFVFKPHLLHGKSGLSFPEGFVDSLTPQERVCTLWWQGTFGCAERVFIDPDELDSYLGGFVAKVLANRRDNDPRDRGLRRLLPGGNR